MRVPMKIRNTKIYKTYIKCLHAQRQNQDFKKPNETRITKFFFPVENVCPLIGH